MNTWFVTGTDTEIGKTLATSDLMRHLADQGYRVAGLKPLASGCERTGEGLRSADALSLMRAANVELPYGQVNPYAFEPAVAPHLAAMAAGTEIDLDRIGAVQEDLEADWLLVEGIGGWSVPLDDKRLLRDLAQTFTRQVVLVVGLRLGCINHALLSAEQIHRDGFELVGWVANRLVPDMPELEGNQATLDRLLPAPRIGTIPYLREETQGVAGKWRLPLTTLR